MDYTVGSSAENRGVKVDCDGSGENPNLCAAAPRQTVYPWRPNPFDYGPPLYRQDIKRVLAQLAGAASTCWRGGTGDLEFESDQAAKFVDQAYEVVKDIIRTQLGAAEGALGLNE